MASLKDQLSGLGYSSANSSSAKSSSAKSSSAKSTTSVYSTEKGQLCSGCAEAISACVCAEISDQQRLESLDGVVRIRRETSGRKGKGVTTITGVPLKESALKDLAKQLKKVCGTGGSLKDGVIEIQGDHREKLKATLEKQGFTVKLAGG